MCLAGSPSPSLSSQTSWLMGRLCNLKLNKPVVITSLARAMPPPYKQADIIMTHRTQLKMQNWNANSNRYSCELNYNISEDICSFLMECTCSVPQYHVSHTGMATRYTTRTIICVHSHLVLTPLLTHSEPILWDQ